MEHEKITELLTANGLQPNAARVLACFEDDDKLTTWDIEVATQISQPHISMATRDLHRRGWLSIKRQRQEGKRNGRPINVYSLSKPLADIARDIVRERTREIDRAQEQAAQLLQAVA